MRGWLPILLACCLVLSPLAASAGWSQDFVGQAQPAPQQTQASRLTSEQLAKAQEALKDPATLAKVQKAMKNPEFMAKVQKVLIQLNGQKLQATPAVPAQPTPAELEVQRLRKLIADVEAKQQARNMLRQGWMLGLDTAAALRLAGYNPEVMRGGYWVTGPNGQQVFLNGPNPAVPAAVNQPKGFWDSMTTGEKFLAGFMLVVALSTAGVVPFAAWFPL